MDTQPVSCYEYPGACKSFFCAH